jgi:hydroxyethylthiazole kinase-like uncharacterized protein yjeF
LRGERRLAIKTLTVREIRTLERWAIVKIGIPSLALMENAGRRSAMEVLKKLKGRSRASVVIACGAGNNGGDGFVAARYLSKRGIKLQVFLIGNPNRFKADALANYQAAKKLKIHIKPIQDAEGAFRKSLEKADIVVDALFGVGLNRPLQGPYDGIIRAINDSGAYVVAIDIPSGLDGTTGEIYGVCVKADLTVTFSYPKKGFFKRHGPAHTGRLVVADIGIPPKKK